MCTEDKKIFTARNKFIFQRRDRYSWDPSTNFIGLSDDMASEQMNVDVTGWYVRWKCPKQVNDDFRTAHVLKIPFRYNYVKILKLLAISSCAPLRLMGSLLIIWTLQFCDTRKQSGVHEEITRALSNVSEKINEKCNPKQNSINNKFLIYKLLRHVHMRFITK